MNAYRHGDVLLIPTRIPADAVTAKRHRRGLVLAEGEVTGHAHVITSHDAELLILPADRDELERMFLRVQDEVQLTHEEHATITIPPGEYERIIQVEYTPEALQRVTD